MIVRAQGETSHGPETKGTNKHSLVGCPALLCRCRLLVALLAEFGKQRLGLAGTEVQSFISTGYIRIGPDTQHILLEALALQVTQLLGTRAHDVVRWGDVGSGLSVDGLLVLSLSLEKATAGAVCSLLAIVQLALQHLPVVVH